MHVVRSWIPASWAGAILCLVFGLQAPDSRAQGYPNQRINVVVAFAPGGTVDLVGRTVASALNKRLGVPVVVQNITGASGEIGTAGVVRSSPDGYTLMVGSTTSITIRPLYEPPLPYNPATDLVPVALVASVPHVLMVGPSVRARTLAELVAYSRAQKQPLSLGDSGVGSPHYLAGDWLKHATGMKVNHIPYRGTSAVITDLMAGHIDMASIELSIARTYMKDGKLTPIGLSASRRDAEWPNLPTIAEQGVVDYEITSWFGIFAPAKTPTDIVQKLNREINLVLTDPEVRDALTTAGLQVLGGSVDDFRAHLKREQVKWERAVKLSQANPEKPAQ